MEWKPRIGTALAVIAAPSARILASIAEHPCGILLLLAYGIGHCSVIVLAGTSTELVQRYLNWNERSKGAVILKRICGVLVLLGGLYLIYIAG